MVMPVWWNYPNILVIAQLLFHLQICFEPSGEPAVYLGNTPKCMLHSVTFSHYEFLVYFSLHHSLPRLEGREWHVGERPHYELKKK